MAARAIWTGALSFGLLNIPVQLYSGERGGAVPKFRMLDGRDHQPIKYQRINAETGKEVPWEEIVKAYEYEKGNFVVIDEADIKKAMPEATQTVDIEAFVPRDAIDERWFVKPYYLLPGKKAEKGYVLLRETLEKTGRVGIARVVMRTSEYLCAVMPVDSALVLAVLRYADEVVQADEFTLPDAKLENYRVSKAEVEMAAKLIESMGADWNPEDYKSDFGEKIHAVIEAKIAAESGKPVKVARETRAAPAATNVVDFMALLKQSLDGDSPRGRKGGRKAAAAEDEAPAAKAKPRTRAARARPAKPRGRKAG